MESDHNSVVGDGDLDVDREIDEETQEDIGTNAATPQSPRGPTPPPDEVVASTSTSLMTDEPKSVPNILKKKASEYQSKRSDFAFSPGVKKGGVVKRQRKMDDIDVQEKQRTEAIQKMATVVQGALEPRRNSKDAVQEPDPNDAWWKVIKERMSRMTPEVNNEYIGCNQKFVSKLYSCCSKHTAY